MEHGSQVPSEWVRRWADRIPPGARVLDLACGQGRHARFFAARHALVTALDRDESVLAGMRGLDAITLVTADVEAGVWPFESGAFDAIIVTNYLHRPLLPRLVSALATGGMLIYETFMLGNERYGKPSNPQFLLRPGELLEAFGAVLQVVAFEQGLIDRPKPAVVQRICLKNQQNQLVSLQ